MNYEYKHIRNYIYIKLILNNISGIKYNFYLNNLISTGFLMGNPPTPPGATSAWPAAWWPEIIIMKS